MSQNYDIDGIFLDFLRFTAYFDNYTNPPYLSAAERQAIMSGFIADVRSVLDAAAGEGKHIWLGARIPHLTQAFIDIGVDLSGWKTAGLDFAVVSSYYEHNQQTEFTQIQATEPDLSLFSEMTYCNSRGIMNVDNYRHHSSDSQYYASANLALMQGAKGFLIHNFVYPRTYLKYEPPFQIFDVLKKPELLARQSQWYFLDYIDRMYQGPTRPNWPVSKVPFNLSSSQSKTISMQLAPTDHHKRNGLLRIMLSEPNDIVASQWVVKLNGNELKPTVFMQKPLPHPYELSFTDTDNGWYPRTNWFSFDCPREYVIRGNNELYIKNNRTSGATAKIQYIDLTFEAQKQTSTDIAQNAVDFPGLTLWLDASYGVTTNGEANGSKVVKWEDRLTRYNVYNNYAHYHGSTEDKLPVLEPAGLNSRAAISFDGSQELRLIRTMRRWG